jgi:(S)-sulfolactate dehydrogenase
MHRTGVLMRRVIVSEFLQEEFLDLIRADFEVVYDPDIYSDPDRLLRELADAEAILIRNRTRIDRELLSAAQALKVVGRLGVGLDNIDMVACADARVEVIPAVGANAVSVAEYVIGAMLVLLRGVYGMTESMVAGGWPRQGHAFGREASGKTLGLIGFGSIGREVAVRARGLEMRIVAHDPYVAGSDERWRTAEQMSLPDLLASSDVISVHIPFNEQTRNLIDRPALTLMKPAAIVINTSRGGIVDEAALAAALRNGTIGGAALDVFDVEPLGPAPASRFRGLSNLLLTPHVAGNTAESVDRVASMIVAAVLQRLET